MLIDNKFDQGFVVIPLLSNTTETYTGYSVPANHVIYPWDMFLYVEVPASGKTIDIGIGMGSEPGYDSDGFVAAASIATAGLFCVASLITATNGTNQNYISSNKVGALFYSGINGADTTGDAGLPLFKPFIGNGVLKSVCYTCSSGTSGFVGKLLIRTTVLPLR